MIPKKIKNTILLTWIVTSRRLNSVNGFMQCYSWVSPGSSNTCHVWMQFEQWRKQTDHTPKNWPVP